jgi:type IVB pilus formation R64 PilN family outer membrane protein
MRRAVCSVWLAKLLLIHGVGLVAGCAIDERVATHREATKAEAQNLKHISDRFQEKTKQHTIASSDHRINKPWVSGQAIALAPEVNLPKALRAGVKTVLIFRNQSASLSEISQRIALATGIPVRVLPEALLAAHHFMPRLQDIKIDAIATPLAEPLMPMGTRPLSEVLDLVAAILDVHWRYTGKAIEFYRTQTRVFDIRALTLAANTQMQLGRSGGQSAGGFDSSAQTTLSMTSQPLLDDIRQRIEPFMTRAGTIAAQPGGLSSVVVTDTPAVLDAIAAYLDSVNRTMTQRVRLVFEEMTVTRTQAHEQGIDWSLAVATEMAEMTAGSTVLGGVAPVMAGVNAAVPAMNGLASNVLVRAVSKYADIRRHTTVPVVTLNRRPVTHAVRSTFTYVDQIQSVGVSKKEEGRASLPGIAVSQKRETVGAFLTLVPDIQVDGQVLLSVAYDNTTASPLKTLTFGGSEQSLQLQQINLQGNGTIQQVALFAGQPTLIAGFEQRDDESQQARLSPDAPRLLGGNDKIEHRKSMTLIFVTAQVEDGI